MKQPYRITACTLVTYSGKKIKAQVNSGWITSPLRKVKDALLDNFCRKDVPDPIIRIENVIVEPFINQPCY